MICSHMKMKLAGFDNHTNCKRGGSPFKRKYPFQLPPSRPFSIIFNCKYLLSFLQILFLLNINLLLFSASLFTMPKNSCMNEGCCRTQAIVISSGLARSAGRRSPRAPSLGGPHNDRVYREAYMEGVIKKDSDYLNQSLYGNFKILRVHQFLYLQHAQCKNII